MLSQECSDFLTSLGYNKMPRPAAPPVVEGKPIYAADSELWCHKDGFPWPPMEFSPSAEPKVEGLVKGMVYLASETGARNEASCRSNELDRLLSKRPISFREISRSHC